MAVRKALAQACRELPQQTAWRWVNPELYHVTLAFLGECGRQEYPGVLELGARAARKVGPFPLECAGLGIFPKGGNRPRVLWAGFRSSFPMDRLAQALSLGAGPPANAHHLTLARRKKGKFGSFELPRGVLSRSWGEWTVKELQLWESELTRSGPVYAVRERWSLNER